MDNAVLSLELSTDPQLPLQLAPLAVLALAAADRASPADPPPAWPDDVDAFVSTVEAGPFNDTVVAAYAQAALNSRSPLVQA